MNNLKNRFWVLSNIGRRVAALLMAAAVFASGTLSAKAAQAEATGRVRPYFWGGGVYLDISATTQSNTPACATRPTIARLSTAPGNADFSGTFALLLAAWYSGQPVVLLDDSGQCDSQGDQIFGIVEPAPSS